MRPLYLMHLGEAMQRKGRALSAPNWSPDCIFDSSKRLLQGPRDVMMASKLPRRLDLSACSEFDEVTKPDESLDVLGVVN